MAGINGAAFPARAVEPDVKTVHLVATGTDDSNLTIVYGKGISTGARTAEGKYTLTFNNYGNRLLYAHGTVATAVDAIGKDVEVKTVTLAGTGTVLIEIWTRATDLAAAAQEDLLVNETLRMVFVFSNQN